MARSEQVSGTPGLGLKCREDYWESLKVGKECMSHYEEAEKARDASMGSKYGYEVSW